MLDYLDISCLRSMYWLHCCGINYCVSACKWCNVTAAQKIIKNSNHSYIRNVLHIKFVKLQSIWKSGSGSGSGRICHSKSGSGRIGKNKSGTAL